MSEWLRDGNLLYTLKHAGWSRGVEQLRNATTVRVYGDDAEAVTEYLLDCLKKQQEKENR